MGAKRIRCARPGGGYCTSSYLAGRNGKTQRVMKRANKEKVSGKNSGGTGISSAAPIVGAVFGLPVKGVFSNALTLRSSSAVIDILVKRSILSIPRAFDEGF